jgi:ABC-type antimicrobial peptide transport system permease subunit
LPIQTVIDLNDRLSTSSSDSDDLVYNQIIVQASSREAVDTLMDDLQELGYNATGMGSYLSQLNGFFGIMRLMLGGVGGVALLVAAFGVANTMTMAILERTREIGLMKAVGATDRAVLTVFLIEAGLVGLIGGISGLAISYLLQYVVNTLLANNLSGTISIMSINITQLNGSLIVIPAQLSILALGLATGIGIGAGLSPALRAARMTTVIALRTE